MDSRNVMKNKSVFHSMFYCHKVVHDSNNIYFSDIFPIFFGYFFGIFPIFFRYFSDIFPILLLNTDLTRFVNLTSYRRYTT